MKPIELIIKIIFNNEITFISLWKKSIAKLKIKINVFSRGLKLKKKFINKAKKVKTIAPIIIISV